MKKLFLLAVFALMGLSSGAQEPVFSSEQVTVYAGDTIRVVNFENLLERELFLDGREMKGFFVTSSLDREETKHYRLSSMLATTAFTVLGMEKKGIGNKYFTLQNIVTGDKYGIPVVRGVNLDKHIVNLSGQRREAREKYQQNLAAEKAVRGECDKRISIRPWDIDSDMAVWNEKKIVMINGTAYQFADIKGCTLDSMKVQKPAEFDHDKAAKLMRKKQTLGEVIAGDLGVAAATVAVGATAMKDMVKNTKEVTEYIVTVHTSAQARPVIEINAGEDKAKADEVVALIDSVIAK